MRVLAALAVLMAVGQGAAAQDLVLDNARIVVGTGAVIDNGTIVVQNGRLSSVSTEPAPPGLAPHFDVEGMTVIPGMIDAHVHFTLPVTTSVPDSMLAQAAETMEAYVSAGVTTAFDNAGHLPTLIRARTLIESGDLRGPRLMIVGAIVGPGSHPVSTVCRLRPQGCADGSVVEVDDPDVARAEVRRFAALGVDMIKSIYEATPTPESRIKDDVLAAVAQEAEAQGLPLVVHALQGADALRGVELGAEKLAHAPLSPVRQPVDIVEIAERLTGASVPFVTTSHLFAPIVNGLGEFRGHRAGMTVPYGPEDMALHIEYMTRMRRIFDSGVLVVFGTDGFETDEFYHELQTLRRVFSPSEILGMLTRDAAAYLGLEDQVGTLEAGKLADLAVIDGDPLADVSELHNVSMVIKGGRVIVDRRSGAGL